MVIIIHRRIIVTNVVHHGVVSSFIYESNCTAIPKKTHLNVSLTGYTDMNMKCTSAVHLTIISIIVALMYKVQLGSVMYMLMKN